MKFAVKATIFSLLSAALLLPAPAPASWYEEGEVWAGIGAGILVGSILTNEWNRPCRVDYGYGYGPSYGGGYSYEGSSYGPYSRESGTTAGSGAYGPEYSGGYYEETRVWPFYRHVEYQAPVRLMPANPAPQAISMSQRRAERANDAVPAYDDGGVTREENRGEYGAEQISHRPAAPVARTVTVRQSNAAGSAAKAVSAPKAESVPQAKLVSERKADVPAPKVEAPDEKPDTTKAVGANEV